jgi:serine/threonine protein kinase
LYRIEIAKRRYVAKVYPPCRLAHYGRELSLLQSMNHPNIIKPLAPDSALNAKLAPIFKTDLIVFPEAARGSLLSYLQTNRALSERVARFYMTKIVSALLYA